MNISDNKLSEILEISLCLVLWAKAIRISPKTSSINSDLKFPGIVFAISFRSNQKLVLKEASAMIISSYE